MQRKTKAISICRTALIVAAASIYMRNGNAEPLRRAFTKGNVHVEITVDPEVVDLARDTEVTIATSAPENIAVQLQSDVSTRFEGFSLAGSYGAHGAQPGGAPSIAQHYRLTPIPGAPRYRIRPIVVTTTDSSTFPAASGWFSTDMIAIPAATTADDAKKTVSSDLVPVRIRPSLRVIPWTLGGIALAALAVLLLVKIIGHISMRSRIRRMAPRERALLELDHLLSRKLPERGLFKDFYIDLTMVVRRYVERRYGIRAPKQTTEEFLEAAALRPEFGRDSLTNMRQFLSAADLVKFAGVDASVASASEAADKARNYLVREPAQQQGESEASKGARV